MFRSVMLLTALAGSGALLAQDPPPVAKAVQPRIAPAQPGAIQPALPIRVSPTLLARYEEEADVLDAQLDVKKAYIRAAEVAVVGAKVKLERAVKLAVNKIVSNEEVQLALQDLDTAAAQLEIRKAESKEVEVKLKYAKKRLEDAKAGGVRPAARPAIDPKRIDPRP